MITTIAFAALICASGIQDQDVAQKEPIKSAKTTETVAVLPFAMQAGTPTAVQTAKDTLIGLFAAEGVLEVEKAKVLRAWVDTLGFKHPGEQYEAMEYVADLPRAQALLKLGQELGVDYVCAGRLTWHTTSKWVALGPKTKAYAYLDLMLIDVEEKLILVDAKRIETDSTRIEKSWETAASLLISSGFTMLSGGPKTPHQQRAAQMAIAKALEPWLLEREVARRIKKRIGGS